MMNKSFNETHPELQPGEMFLTNIPTRNGCINSDYYNLIGYKTKRRGNIAFTKYGEITDNMYSLFVQISEFNEVQKNYEHKKFRF